MPKKRIVLVGSAKTGPEGLKTAFDMGRLIGESGFDLVCGGTAGVMEAACQGAKTAGAMTIGILPGLDFAAANAFVDVPVVTGLSHMRNFLVVQNGEAVVAVEGGSGTLSEIGLALKSGKKVVAIGTWSALPGVVAAKDAHQAMEILKKLLAAQAE